MVFLLLDVFRVFGSVVFLLQYVGVSGLFVFSWAWLGMGFAYFVLPTPPRSVSGLTWVIGPFIGGTGRVSRVVVWV